MADGLLCVLRAGMGHAPMQQSRSTPSCPFGTTHPALRETHSQPAPLACPLETRQGRYCHEATKSRPIIGDGDTGYGNAMNVKRTVRGYASAGFAGVARRCSSM